jgi:hypothetical protein
MGGFGIANSIYQRKIEGRTESIKPNTWLDIKSERLLV